MKIVALMAVGLLTAFAPPQDDVEAKKKRLGEILRENYHKQVEAEKLMNELTGGDREKKAALMEELLKKYVPEMAEMFAQSQLMSNERVAAVTLKTLASAEADFRANDRDENHANDFWVGDVSGLYRIESNGVAMKMIELATTLADARPAVALDQTGPLPSAPKTKFRAAGKAAPKAGYSFAAIESYVDDNGKTVQYDEGGGRNPTRFGFCSYPVEYGKSGKLTYLINEGNSVFRKDTGGKPLTVFPLDLVKAGWELYR